METTKAKTTVVVLSAMAVLLVLCSPIVAGDLEPSAAPAPTMKTLDEVEPRIPIHASDLPMTISSPGSYYLAENINFTDDANDAITIDRCDSVTIDLMGHTLKGPDSGSKCGIYMTFCRNVEIRNGTIRDFAQYGIREGNGDSHRVIGVRAASNGNTGILLAGANHLVKGCTAEMNRVCGIVVGGCCTVTGNMVSQNAYNLNIVSAMTAGIYAGSGCTVTDNMVCYNGYGTTCLSVIGIRADEGSTVTGNTASWNGYKSTCNQIRGIKVNEGSTVTANTAIYNGGWVTVTGDINGIYTGSGCTVTGNTAASNGKSATGTVYGIYLTGNSLVDQNTAYDNGGTNMDTTLANCTYGVNHAP